MGGWVRTDLIGVPNDLEPVDFLVGAGGEFQLVFVHLAGEPFPKGGGGGFIALGARMVEEHNHTQAAVLWFGCGGWVGWVEENEAVRMSCYGWYEQMLKW